jgi:hypothetical protein
MKRVVRWSLGAAIAGSMLAGPREPEAPARQVRMPTQLGRAGTFRSPRVRESSGVAVSRRHPGILWTHNDSGDGAYLYVSNLAGDDLGRFQLKGVWPEDWEDLSLARCPDQPGDCLFIADTGDNLERRGSVRIYILPEPIDLPAAERDSGMIRLQGTREVRLRYPDRPHDVEAIWVEPGGAVMLVTKGTSGPVLRFVIPRAALLGDSTVPRLVDTLPIEPRRVLGRWVTGAAISPSGRRVVLRTYTELYFFRRQGVALVPDGLPCWLGTAEPQGEGVDFLNEETLVLTSEAVLNQGAPIHTVRCDPA